VEILAITASAWRCGAYRGKIANDCGWAARHPAGKGTLDMLTVVFVLAVLVAAGLILAVLLQAGNPGGMAGSISGMSQQMIGKKRGIDEVLERVTMILGGVLVVLILVAVHMWR
jgi:preprotein translocase subunit SecG